MIQFPNTENIAQTIFSEDRQYRYTLYRNLGLFGSAKVLFVMANPSIANESRNDPTMRRAIYFAKSKLNCRDFLAMNCFALVSTDPQGVRDHRAPVGPLNDIYLRTAAQWADKIVVAWGVLGKYQNRGEQVLELLDGYELLCLGTTNDGHPRHPLYLANDTKVIPFPRRRKT